MKWQALTPHQNFENKKLAKSCFGSSELEEACCRGSYPDNNFSLQQTCTANLQACSKFDTTRVQPQIA
ncbi:hypothetical protein AVEN_218872-1, partial [Araneus ventricosus]